MKVGIVGAGFVGATAGYALVLGEVPSELVFVDARPEKAEGEAMDVSHATPFAHPVRVRAGDYGALAGSEVVLLAAGANQKPGETRLDLIHKNAAIFRQIVPEVVRQAPGALLLVATNPVDALTEVVARESGLPPTRVIGSGTALDTARLRALLAARARLSPRHVHGYVLGEHGDSEMIPWSGASIAGLPLAAYFAQRGLAWGAADEAATLEEVRRAAYEIIARKQATYYGVASALARIVSAIARDERAVLTVSMSEGGVAYSLPRVLGRGGVESTVAVRLTDAEREALEASVGRIRAALDAL